MWRLLALVVGALALVGCSHQYSRPADPAALQEAVQNLNAGLARIPHLNLSDLLSEETGQRYGAASRFVRDRQCASGSANPLLMTSLPMRLTLRGNLDEREGVRFSGVRPAETDDTVVTGFAGNFDIPLRISTLADFPNEYLREMSGLLDGRGLPEETVQKLSKEVPETYQKLGVRVERLMSEFNPAACPRAHRHTNRERILGSSTMIFAPTF